MAEGSRAKKAAGLLIRVVISIGLLTFVLWWVGPKSVWEAVQQCDPATALKYLPLLGLIGCIGALRWRLLLHSQEIDITFWEALKLTWLGFFFCNFLPGLTGDVVKGVYAARHTPHKTRAAISILVDRIVGMQALGLVALLALFICPESEMTRRGMPIALVLVIGCAVITLVFLGGRTWGMDKLARRYPLWGISEEIVKASDLYLGHKASLLAAVFLSLAAHFAAILIYYGYGMSLGITQMGFREYTFVSPIVGLISALPTSIMMGLGIGELSMKWLLGSQGVADNLAVTLSLMFRVSIVFWSLPGGVVVLFYRARKDSNKDGTLK